MTWANQLRLLKLNIQSLGAVIGQGLIAAILPAIKALNKLMEKLIDVAEAFRNFVYTLTGKKIEGSQKGIADMASSGYDASDALGDMTDSAKDLEKALSVLSFDELNQLSKPDEEDKKLTDDIGDFGDALGKNDGDSQVNDWAQKIRDAFLNHEWEKLGEEIAKLINKGLQKIYDAISWKKVGPKITAFVDAFTRTFNSLVDNLDWDLLGRTIGAGINTIVNTLNLLIEGIDWKNLGNKFSNGFRGMIREIEWRNLGNLLGNYFMIAWNILDGFITDMSSKSDAGLTGWAELGNALGEAVNGIFDKVDFTTMANVLVGGFNGVFETLRNFTLTVEWDDIAENITNGLTTMIRGIKWAEAGTSLGMFVTDLLGTFQKIAEETPWVELGEGIGDFLIAIPWGTIFEQVFTIITEIIGGLITGLGNKILDKTEIIGTSLADGINFAISKIKPDDFADAINDILDGIIAFLDTFDWEQFGTKIGELLEGIDWGKVATIIYKALSGALEAWQSSFDAAPIETALLTGVGLLKFTPVGKILLDKIAESIATAATDGAFSVTVYGGISRALITGATSLGGTSSPTFQVVGSEILDGISKVLEELLPDWAFDLLSAIGGGIVTGALVGSWFPGAGTVAGAIIGGITGALSEIEIDGESILKTIIDKIFNWDSTLTVFDQAKKDMKKGGIYIIKGVGEGILAAIGFIVEPIVDFFSGFVEAFCDVFGIHSPAEEMKPLGKNILLGLLEGFGGAFSMMEESVKKLPQKILEWAGNAKEWLREKGKDAIGGLKTGWESVKESSVGQTVSKLGSYVKEKTGDAKSWLVGKGKDVITGLKNGLTNNWNSVTSWLKEIPQKIKNAIPNLFNIGKETIQNFINGFKSLHIPTPHFQQTGTMSIAGIDTPIPTFGVEWYKTGGLFNKASVIGVGEAGREVVLPLENQRTMSMVADSIMSKASPSIDEEVLTNAVAKGVAMAMMNNQQNPVNVTCYAELRTENDEVLARAVTRGQEKIDYRMNPTPQFGY